MWQATTFATFILCGLFFYVLLSAVAAGTTGLTALAAIPIVLALLLGGIAPLVLSLRFRLGIRVGQVLSGLLIAYVLILVASDPSDAFALIAVVPLIGTIAVADMARRKSRNRETDSASERSHPAYLALGGLAATVSAWLIVQIAIRILT